MISWKMRSHILQAAVALLVWAGWEPLINLLEFMAEVCVCTTKPWSLASLS